ncbi:TonB-dependent receptor [Marinigracilibium pacificum]|uniref:TonB-dependent receptor n=1 Tax=Marinigracilibium pacificum TaxID=2729599 RepID=A0A848J183_9BACT|nr:TonB-dependent receptor [Marinigracilibium pacificum]NMM48059.1 TonB-dependent receptor [Marinigracilibium pacificum]
MKTFLQVILYSLVSFISIQLSAQENGRVLIKVVDEFGLPMPGATIVLKGVVEKGNITDVNGQLILLSVPEGKYNLSLTYIGYEKIEEEIKVTGGKTSTLTYELFTSITVGDEVVVIGDRLRGQAKALNKQKNNSNITNVVSSDQLGRFPDANMGDALKRIPGITIQNDQGEARDIIIRGMAPQLNSVMINGERIPSAEGDNRKIQLDLIPSDMIQTVEVSKAVLPDMDADAIGGAVNLITRQAPEDFRLSLTAGSGINFLTDKPIYTGGLVIGDRFADGKLGAILSTSYYNNDFGSENVEAEWFETENGDVVLGEFETRNYFVRRARRSISLDLDYSINENNTIYLSSMYNWRDDWENRFANGFSKLDDAFDDDLATGVSTGIYQMPGRVEYETKGGNNSNRNKNRRLEDQRNRNLQLRGEHILNSVIIDWSVNYAKASEERPNERYISYRSSDMPVTMNLTNSEFPIVALNDLNNQYAIEFREISEEYQYTFDRDLNSRLDFKFPVGEKSIVKSGLRYRNKHKERENNFNFYEPVDLEAFGSTLGAISNLRNLTDPDFNPGSQYQPGDFVSEEFLANLDLNNPLLFDKEDALDEYLPGNYSADEQIYAAYAMVDHQFNDNLSVILGFRVEHTEINYSGYALNIDEETFFNTNGSDSYTNYLPGIHLKYNPNNKTVLRLAWTNTIARPNYYDLVPYAEYSPDDEELVRGNPALKPAKSMNFDFMAERYFESIGIMSGGVFFKNIDDFNYSRSIDNYDDPQFGNGLEYTTFDNGGNANVFGAEIAFQKQIWKGLGIYINYTFTQSTTEGIQGREDEDLELPGTASHMFNGSLSYETSKLVLRVSLNYSDDYIDELGGDQFEDRYYDKQLFLDANASYAFSKNWRLFIEANNLTNQPLRYYQGVSARTMQVEYYNSRVTLGVKFDMFKSSL